MDCSSQCRSVDPRYLAYKRRRDNCKKPLNMRSFQHGSKRELGSIRHFDDVGDSCHGHEKAYGLFVGATAQSSSDHLTHRRNSGSSRVPSEPLDPGETSVVGANNVGHPWSAISFDSDVGGNPGNHERRRASLVSSEARDLYCQKTLTANDLLSWLGFTESKVSWVTF
jgi:hypothetical protein